MIVEFSQARQWRADLARHGKNPALVMRGQVLLDTLPTIGENEVEYERKCKYILCGKTFMAGRKDKEFCCDAHRTAANKLRENEPSSLAKLMTRAVEFDAQFYGHPSNPDVARARDAALRDVLSAIESELGIVHETHDEPDELDEPEDELDVMLPALGLEPQFVRAKLREFMAETGYGQSRIAKLAGVNQATISKFYRNLTNGSPAFRRAIWAVISQDDGMDRR